MVVLLQTRCLFQGPRGQQQEQLRVLKAGFKTLFRVAWQANSRLVRKAPALCLQVPSKTKWVWEATLRTLGKPSN